MVPTGALALVLGPGVSRAFTLIAANMIVPRFMGFLLLLGGVLALCGMLRMNSFIEALGLALLAAGAALYGFGVILGLGMAGMVAGPGYVAIAVALSRRVQILLRLAALDTTEPW
jgi:hypothetical protein